MRTVEQRRLGGCPPKLYTWKRARYSLADWAEISGLPRHTIKDRLEAGWTFAEAIIYLRGDSPPGRGRGRKYERAGAA